MVRVLALDRVKSPDTVFSAAVAETVRVTASLEGHRKEAWTAAVPPSETNVGSMTSRT